MVESRCCSGDATTGVMEMSLKKWSHIIDTYDTCMVNRGGSAQVHKGSTLQVANVTSLRTPVGEKHTFLKQVT